MSNQDIYALSDIATTAQTKIQNDFKSVNPIVGVNRSLRSSGFLADAMTIDCLKTGKRIIFLLHDEKPGIVAYQLGFRDKDPVAEFINLPFEKVTVDQIYKWIKAYFVEESSVI